MKFERKPIEVIPTCPMCTKPIKEHTAEQTKLCMEMRKKAKLKHPN